MLNLYANHAIKVMWNGIHSSSCLVRNGFKQGVIVSLIIVCTYAYSDDGMEVHPLKLWYKSVSESLVIGDVRLQWKKCHLFSVAQHKQNSAKDQLIDFFYDLLKCYHVTTQIEITTVSLWIHFWSLDIQRVCVLSPIVAGKFSNG